MKWLELAGLVVAFIGARVAIRAWARSPYF